MKKIIILIVSAFIISCSSPDDSGNPNNDNNGNNNDSTFSIELSANDTAVIDEIMPVTITSSETMTSLEISFDNFQTSTTSFSNLGSSTQRYFSFDKIGSTTTVYFRAKNSVGNESVQTFTPTIYANHLGFREIIKTALKIKD
ncbi:MAG: hypothetical protein ACWIPJ_07625 [Polaribacter sp.]